MRPRENIRMEGAASKPSMDIHGYILLPAPKKSSPKIFFKIIKELA